MPRHRRADKGLGKSQTPNPSNFTKKSIFLAAYFAKSDKVGAYLAAPWLARALSLHPVS
jgi:hypothetical protein